jgi:hypothetical protein
MLFNVPVKFEGSEVVSEVNTIKTYFPNRNKPGLE